ncbi:MAG: hypothetical protein K0S29_1006 [Gammaproteobacteria bacterium]|jgi:hypothetical protein|nr:hypothetical protein [Gammaproteobacteria bacterium]
MFTNLCTTFYNACCCSRRRPHQQIEEEGPSASRPDAAPDSHWIVGTHVEPKPDEFSYNSIFTNPLLADGFHETYYSGKRLGGFLEIFRKPSSLFDEDRLRAKIKNGFKIHISINTEPKQDRDTFEARIKAAWNAIVPIMMKYGLYEAKVIDIRYIHTKGYQPGKEITLYYFNARPTLNWQEMLSEVEAALISARIEPGNIPNFRIRGEYTSVPEPLVNGSRYMYCEDDSIPSVADLAGRETNLGPFGETLVGSPAPSASVRRTVDDDSFNLAPGPV